MLILVVLGIFFEFFRLAGNGLKVSAVGFFTFHLFGSKLGYIPKISFLGCLEFPEKFEWGGVVGGPTNYFVTPNLS